MTRYTPSVPRDRLQRGYRICTGVLAPFPRPPPPVAQAGCLWSYEHGVQVGGTTPRSTDGSLPNATQPEHLRRGVQIILLVTSVRPEPLGPCSCLEACEPIHPPHFCRAPWCTLSLGPSSPGRAGDAPPPLPGRPAYSCHPRVPRLPPPLRSPLALTAGTTEDLCQLLLILTRSYSIMPLYAREHPGRYGTGLCYTTLWTSALG